MDPIPPVALEDIEAARSRIAEAAVPTPLLPLNEGNGEAADIRVKLECLQPIGSFKIRGAANAMAVAGREALAQGVYTASAGNMAQGVALAAHRMGVACRVIVPDTAPTTKVAAVRRLGGTVVPLPFADWWRVIQDHGHPDEEGFFIHPVSDPAVIAGNGTIGLEILEAWPDVDAIVVPYGGGGLSCGIACATRALRPDLPVIAAEVETAAPLRASLEAGRPLSVDRVPSFVDGIGGSSVLEEMWPLASSLLQGSRVVDLAEVCDAIRELATGIHVVAEGAGGAAVAAARQLVDDGAERVVAVVSGGNIDADDLATILRGSIPGQSSS
jgi:threonine dehydratase